MQFFQFLALQKHVESALGKKEFLSSYLLFHPKKEERRKMGEDIARRILFDSEGTLKIADGKSRKEVFYLLSSPSLFGEREIVFWDIPKALVEEDRTKVSEYLSAPYSNVVLIIGADSPKTVFGSKFEREGASFAVLDLSEEKDRDREKRQRIDLSEAAKREGKTLTQGACDCLLSISEDSLILRSELEKVMTYVGDKVVISEEDVLAVASGSKVVGWKTAEDLVWETTFSLEDIDFGSLIGQVRFILRRAEKTVIDSRAGKPIPKFLLRVTRYEHEYFERALAVLSDWEILHKNGLQDDRSLLLGFSSQLFALKRQYAR